MCLRICFGVAVLLGHLAGAQTTRPVDRIEHVLIISIDGARPDLLLRGDAPRIRRLMESGSYTLWARTTAASTTLPSHVSMLTGVAPEVHGITWNGDLPLSERVYPARPTIFELAKQRGYTTAIATGKSKFNIFDRPGAIDWSYFPETPTSEDPLVTSNAIRILSEHKPSVMLVHLPGFDNAGHSKGWGSPEQMAAMALADKQVGALLDALTELNLADSTVVILSADHGGAGRTHGPDDPRSRTIPWIIAGPGIRRNFDLTRIGDLNVETTDTFATTCALLNIPVERRISGKFVSQILEDRELLKNREPSSMQPATQP
jgi:predicted AlkP superfamily pyrophosphatase or phosphodiesterase